MNIKKILLVTLLFIVILANYTVLAKKSISIEDVISSFEPTLIHECDNSFSIRSFDVNDNGDIIISIRESGNNLLEEMYGKGCYAIYIFDSKMTFQYGIRIRSQENSVGAVWKDGYPTAVIGYNDAFLISFNKNGDVVSFEEIERKNNNAFEKERTVNGKTYILTNSNKASVPKFISASDEYKYLFLKDSDNIQILYENKTSHRSFDYYFPFICIVIMTVIILIVGSVYLVWFVFIKKRINKPLK